MPLSQQEYHQIFTTFKWDSNEGSPFLTWITNNAIAANPRAMNCWEFVLFLGAKNQFYPIAALIKSYRDAQDRVKNANQIFANEKPQNTLSKWTNLRPKFGDAIVFGEVRRHVVFAMGQNHIADLGTYGSKGKICELKETAYTQGENITLIQDHFYHILLDEYYGGAGMGDEALWAEIQSFKAMKFKHVHLVQNKDGNILKRFYSGSKAQTDILIDKMNRAGKAQEKTYLVPREIWTNKVMSFS